jgi:hypothetical protein
MCQRTFGVDIPKIHIQRTRSDLGYGLLREHHILQDRHNDAKSEYQKAGPEELLPVKISQPENYDTSRNLIEFSKAICLAGLPVMNSFAGVDRE